MVVGCRMENTSLHPIMVELPALPFANPFLEIALEPRTRLIQIPNADRSKGDRRQLNTHGCVIRSVAIAFDRAFSASVVSSPEAARQLIAASVDCEHIEKCSRCSEYLREQVEKAFSQSYVDEQLRNM